MYNCIFILLKRVNNALNKIYCSKMNAVCGDDCNVYIDYNRNNITNSRIILLYMVGRRRRPKRYVKIYVLVYQYYYITVFRQTT